MRSGIVAVVGRPNVGKSTLINALVGQKVSIVSRRPQTTRHAIQGVMHGPDHQVVFVDTPGLHGKEHRTLNRRMNRAALRGMADADLVLLLVQAGVARDDDELALRHVVACGSPTALVITQVDRLRDKSLVAQDIAHWSQRHDWAFVVPVSARRGINIQPLREEIIARMPEGPALYPPDVVRGYDFSFAVSEIVREKLFERLHDELPHALAVQTESIEEDGELLRIHAIIWVERESQKKIVIGRGGEVLKQAGKRAREELEAMSGRRVFLKLWVRVRPDWSDDARALSELGLGDG